MENLSTSTASSLQLGDIYYVIFRHKWKIVLCTIAGIAAAFAFYQENPPPYSSTAELFIRYVTESRGIRPTGEEELERKTPGQRGDTTLASEQAILTSLNVAKQVAQTIGTEKVLANYGGGDAVDKAAGVISNGLVVEIPKSSAVINITFTHSDRDIVQPILTQIITQYLKRHLEIHRGSGMVDSFLIEQTDQSRAQLAQTEEELRQANAKAGVISAEESKSYYASTISRLKQDIFNCRHTPLNIQIRAKH